MKWLNEFRYNYSILIQMEVYECNYLAPATTIQKVFRGWIFRLKRLPIIMYKIQNILQIQSFQFSHDNEDGRINSCIDEDGIITILSDNFGERIKKPKIRMWYDILAFDYFYGWIPINIKTTTTLTCDNTGNLAMCVYSYTDEVLDIHRVKSYENGMMSVLLINKLKNKQYNTTPKKDYYFIVMNKTNAQDVIVNSVKGLTILTSNVNNLPFQICWNKNRIFTYGSIKSRIMLFLECLRKPRPSWKEEFMTNIRIL